MESKNRQFLSKGSFGTVYYDKTNNIVSKYIYIYDNNSIYIENNIKEILFHCLTTFNFFSKVPSSFPRIKSIVFKDNYCIINMPYYGRPFNDVSFSELSVSYIFHLINSLYFLHSHSFSHGDLKPSNILVSGEKLCLIDYGSICFKHLEKIKNYTQRCTVYYVSPEECKLDSYYISTDIWSLGCIIFEHIVRKKFLELVFKELKLNYDEFENIAINTKEFKKPYKILDILYTEITQDIIDKIIDKNIYYNSTNNRYFYYNSLIKNCLQLSREKRYNTFELLQSPIFEGYEPIDIDFNTNKNLYQETVLYYDKNINKFMNTMYNSILYLKTINKMKCDITDYDTAKLCKILSYIILLNYSIKEDKFITQYLKKFFAVMPYLIKIINSRDIF
jgi:serine/threonine protein kinase